MLVPLLHSFVGACRYEMCVNNVQQFRHATNYDVSVFDE